MKSTKGVAQNDTQSDTQGDTQDGTQDDTQDVTQDVTQGVTQDKELDDWIEKQIWNNPQILTEDLAKLSNRSSKTTKRHLVKMPHIRYVGSGYSGHWEVLEKRWLALQPQKIQLQKTPEWIILGFVFVA